MKEYCSYCNREFNLDTSEISKFERRDNFELEVTCPYCHRRINLYGESKSRYNLSEDTLLSVSKINEIERKQIELLREYAKLQRMKDNYIKHVQNTNSVDVSNLWRKTEEIVQIGLDEENTEVRNYRSKRRR
ncbi:unknown [Firmicutes bacterium CAG:884]|jgi:DNA-directed RNA polymerase subunit RPC12/RpoP|nr:hypothetical protein [Bacillota bacterium]CCY94515.1 unknown [Firmicutes bacterium CAG:884]